MLTSWQPLLLPGVLPRPSGLGHGREVGVAREEWKALKSGRWKGFMVSRLALSPSGEWPWGGLSSPFCARSVMGCTTLSCCAD